jgi:hypothetical protein
VAKKKKLTRSIQKWSEAELKELKELFQDFLKPPGKSPRLEDCRKAINLSKARGGVLHKRQWETIKKKVFYLNNKKYKRLN